MMGDSKLESRLFFITRLKDGGKRDIRQMGSESIEPASSIHEVDPLSTRVGPGRVRKLVVYINF